MQEELARQKAVPAGGDQVKCLFCRLLEAQHPCGQDRGFFFSDWVWRHRHRPPRALGAIFNPPSKQLNGAIGTGIFSGNLRQCRADELAVDLMAGGAGFALEQGFAILRHSRLQAQHAAEGEQGE
jgi:hypothetical protein